jgi:hypothetical protein
MAAMQLCSSPRKADVVALWAAAAVAGGLLIVRKAVAAPITHDEAITILAYAWNTPVEVWSMAAYPDAGNHILNTILIGYSHRLFGISEWASRLPNITAFTMAAAATSLICLGQLSLRGLVAAGAVACVLFQPIVLDYFALARGYGLAAAFMLVAIWQAQCFLVEKPSARRAVLAQLAAGLAVLSNFALLNYFLVQTAVFCAVIMRWGRPHPGEPPVSGRRRAQLLATIIGTGGILAGMVWLPLSVLRAGDAFYFGGTGTFWSDTVGSLVEDLLYRSGAERDGRRRLLELAVLSVLVAALWQIWRSRTRLWPLPAHAFYLLLLTGIAAATMLQHYLLGVPFLIHRTASFLIPIFLLLIISIAARDRHRIGAAFILLGGLLTVLHLAATYHPERHLAWAYDRDTPEMLEVLSRQVDTPGDVIDLAVSWQYEPAVNYYIRRQGIQWLAPVTRAGVDRRADFYYVIPESQAEFVQWLAQEQGSVSREAGVASASVALLTRFSEGGALYGNRTVWPGESGQKPD